MENLKIRSKLKEKNVFQWQVAKSMGISEMTLVRKLREELTEEEQKNILAIIEEIAVKNNNKKELEKEEKQKWLKQQ